MAAACVASSSATSCCSILAAVDLMFLPACDEGSGAAAGKVGGFSLHAGVAARADELG